MASSRPSTATHSSEATTVRPPPPLPRAARPDGALTYRARPASHAAERASPRAQCSTSARKSGRGLEGKSRSAVHMPPAPGQSPNQSDGGSARSATTAESGRRAGHRGALKFTLASESTSNLQALHTTDTRARPPASIARACTAPPGADALLGEFPRGAFARSARSSRATAARAALGAAPWRAGGRSHRPR